MEKDIPLLDNFYDDIPYLTPETILGETEFKINEAVKRYKINTAVVCWIDSLQVLDECEFIAKDHVRQAWVWNKKILIEVTVIGAPNAACMIEFLNYHGIKKVIALGTAGCIDVNFDTSKLAVIEKAIRDEGVSYHYMEPSIYVDLHKELTKKLIKFLNKKNIDYIKTITWTTDGLFRETKHRIAKRLSQGAKSVDMECSALATVCKYYNIEFCQFLFFSDTIKENSWEWIASLETKEQNYNKRSALLRLAIEFAEEVSNG